MSRSIRGALALAALASFVMSGASCVSDVILGGLGGPGGAASTSVTSGAGGSTSSGVDQCTGKICGDSCDLMVCEGDACMAMPGQCDIDFHCVPGPVSCHYQPCAGLLCGAPCNPGCPSGDPNCPASDAYFCDDFGSCNHGPPCCGGMCPPPFSDCTGAPCGLDCFVCDPMQNPQACAGFVCDGFNNCAPVELTTCPAGQQPCAASSCGDPCTICNPMLDMGCVEPMGFKLACNSYGQCADPETNVGSCMTKTSCDGKLCNDPCWLCDPVLDANCPMGASPDGACDMFGKCVLAPDAPYCSCGDAMALKTCGTPCEACKAGDMGCYDQNGAVMCDGQGKCVPQAMCP